MADDGSDVAGLLGWPQLRSRSWQSCCGGFSSRREQHDAPAQGLRDLNRATPFFRPVRRMGRNGAG